MFSPKNNCWKLLDFDNSQYVDHRGVYENPEENCVVGTEGYCAPECESLHVYSIKSDIYSLGMCFMEYLWEGLMSFIEFDDADDEFDAFIMQVEDVVKTLMLAKCPDDRVQPFDVLTSIKPIYDAAKEKYAHRKRFHFYDLCDQIRLLRYISNSLLYQSHF
jgi:serine/threonine protein kinase